MYVKLGYILAWIFFFFVHSTLASGKVKRKLQTLIRFRYYRIFYNVFSIFTLVPIFLLSRKFNAVPFLDTSIYLQIIGLVVVLLSLFLWWKTFDNYSLSEFAGTDRLAKDYSLKLKLRTEGLNQLVRHPLYSISYLFLIGLILFSPTDIMLITACLVFLYIPIGVYFEELKLKQLFGEEYKIYQDKTPSLFPKPGSLFKLKF